MRYKVHVYEIVRVPIEVEADSQQEAVNKVRDAQLTAADDDYNPYDAFRTNPNAEYAEDTDGYLVDEIGDEEYSDSHWYDKSGARQSLESPCAGCGKSPQDCICREPKIQALIDCARDVINNWESGDLAAAVTELQFALNDLGYKTEVPHA